MKEKTDINKAVVQAMKEFEDVLDVIYAMQDNDYISVSNFARVLNKILDTDRVTASKLNKVLAKVKVIKRVKKQDYDLLYQQGLKPSRYILGNDEFIPYSQRKYCDDYSFYMFKPCIYLVILDINVLDEKVTDEMAINLIVLMKRKKYADINTVKERLKAFQTLILYL